MADNREQRIEKKVRVWAKCSACRQRKAKCKPTARDWDTEKQKCDHCAAHDLPCGPSYTKTKDPLVALLSTATAAPVQGHIAGAVDPDEVSQAITKSPKARSASMVPIPSLRCKETNGKSVTTIESLQERTLMKLNDLNALGATLSQQLQNPPSYCHIHCTPNSFDIASMKERLHILFIDIYRIGAQSLDAGHQDQVRWTMYALTFALDRYPVLRDGRRKDVLLKMAMIWKELGHHWEYEHVLEIVTGLQNAVSPFLEENPCHLLASSLSHTSKVIKGVLEDLWRETSVIDDVPSDLAFAPIHRAARLQNGDIVSNILAQHYAVKAIVAKENEQRLRVAESLHIIPEALKARLDVDTRDRCKRTPLFLAAAWGSYHSCYALIAALADPNLRDEHGHTILEVACKGGYFDIAKLLVGVGAEINPQSMWSTSSPLQAAIESQNFNGKLVRFLIDRGAYFAVERMVDGKSAIDVAADGEHTQLADYMRLQHSDTSFFGIEMSLDGFSWGQTPL